MIGREKNVKYRKGFGLSLVKMVKTIILMKIH